MARSVKKDGKVTVVVPVYNRESMVGDCVKSIQDQEYTNLKIVVVDDGSTDGTVDVVKALQKSDKRVHLVEHESNTGSMNTALNVAIKKCDTEYFTWLGSDDTYCVTSAIYQLVGQHQQNPKVDYVSCDLKMSQEGHAPCVYCDSAWPNWRGFASVNPLKPYDAQSYTSLVYRSLCPPFPWNGMWKTQFFVDNNITWIEYEGNTWSPDTLNGLHFFAHGMTMTHYNEFPLIAYRMHNTQDTVTGAISEQIRCDITLINAIHEWFSTEVFLGEKLDGDDAHIAYLQRLKELTEHHAARFKGSDKIAAALSSVAVNALTYMWKHNLSRDEDLKSFFQGYL